MKLKTIQELDFAAQRAMIGGTATTGCTCSTCTCECAENQNSSNIDSKADNVKSAVASQIK